jgi:transposase, IS6 family
MTRRRQAIQVREDRPFKGRQFRVKRLTGPGLGFRGFWTARRTLAGYDAMAMIKKGQVRNISGNDIRAQAAFIAGLFQVAA